MDKLIETYRRRILKQRYYATSVKQAVTALLLSLIKAALTRSS